jgi:hypothetical protein
LKKFFITNPLILAEQNSLKIIGTFFNPLKHKKKLIKSANARVTGTIPYCHSKVPHSRKLLSLCSNDFKGNYTSEAACQHNSSETTEQNFMKLGR